MDESPEIVKMLKYVLFSVLLSDIILGNSQPLVTESPSVVPVPFNQPEDMRSDLISSFTGRETFQSGMKLMLRPRDLDPDASPMSGGHKEVRQAPSHAPPGIQMRPPGPPLSGTAGPNQQENFQRDGLGSLCSIFRTFLEPRSFHRCHVSNHGPPQQNGPSSPHNNNNRPPPPNYFERPHNNNGPPQPRPLHSNDLEIASDDHHHHHQMIQNGPPTGPGELHHDKSSPSSGSNLLNANKRYDHIDDIQINHSGEEDGDGDHHHHLILSPLPPPPHLHHEQDPTKISQDRTMIVVPERSCRQGERRDPRGYCRRLVKIRTNYQYGPPQNIVRPIPIRYYYSRIVTIPNIHFFFPR